MLYTGLDGRRKAERKSLERGRSGGEHRGGRLIFQCPQSNLARNSLEPAPNTAAGSGGDKQRDAVTTALNPFETRNVDEGGAATSPMEAVLSSLPSPGRA